MLDIAAKGNELFDLSDEGTKAAYDELRETTKPTADPRHINRDTTSWQEIEDAVHSAVRQHKGNGTVIVYGAYQHIIGALVHLAKSAEFNIRYVPVDNWQISTKTTDTLNHDICISTDKLRDQIVREIGVAKHLGFNDMESMRIHLDSTLSLSL
jgi:hypothetical protein